MCGCLHFPSFFPFEIREPCHQQRVENCSRCFWLEGEHWSLSHLQVTGEQALRFHVTPCSLSHSSCEGRSACFQKSPLFLVFPTHQRCTRAKMSSELWSALLQFYLKDIFRASWGNNFVIKVLCGKGEKFMTFWSDFLFKDFLQSYSKMVLFCIYFDIGEPYNWSSHE